jgi:hypothetical protein
MTTVLIALVLLQAAAIVFSFTIPKHRLATWWLYVPSLAIAWGAYILYESVYLPRHCTGECNIRTDLLLIYPYLAFVTISAIAYCSRRARAR